MVKDINFKGKKGSTHMCEKESLHISTWQTLFVSPSHTHRVSEREKHNTQNLNLLCDVNIKKINGFVCTLTEFLIENLSKIRKSLFILFYYISLILSAILLLCCCFDFYCYCRCCVVERALLK
jgi:hypothetical protein